MRFLWPDLNENASETLSDRETQDQPEEMQIWWELAAQMLLHVSAPSLMPDCACRRGVREERERERWWCFGFLLHQIVLINSVRVKPTWLQTEHGVCFTSWHQTQPLKWGVKEQLHQILPHWGVFKGLHRWKGLGRLASRLKQVMSLSGPVASWVMQGQPLKSSLLF